MRAGAGKFEEEGREGGRGAVGSRRRLLGEGGAEGRQVCAAWWGKCRGRAGAQGKDGRPEEAASWRRQLRRGTACRSITWQYRRAVHSSDTLRATPTCALRIAAACTKAAWAGSAALKTTGVGKLRGRWGGRGREASKRAGGRQRRRRRQAEGVQWRRGKGADGPSKVDWRRGGWVWWARWWWWWRWADNTGIWFACRTPTPAPLHFLSPPAPRPAALPPPLPLLPHPCCCCCTPAPLLLLHPIARALLAAPQHPCCALLTAPHPAHPAAAPHTLLPAPRPTRPATPTHSCRAPSSPLGRRPEECACGGLGILREGEDKLQAGKEGGQTGWLVGRHMEQAGRQAGRQVRAGRQAGRQGEGGARQG